jgi:hypothetical protein
MSRRLLVSSLLCFLTLQFGKAPACEAVQGQDSARTPQVATVAGASSAQVLLWTGDKAKKRWVEVTPFAPDARDKLVQFPEGSASVPLEGLPPGPAFLCAGAEGRPTRCEKVFVEAGKPLSVTTPAAGVRITGRLLIGRKPAPGTKIGVVPHPLPMRRFFSMPLGLDGEKAIPYVETDAAGRFTLPQLSPGDYRLDLRPPGGRLDQAGPFTVPDPGKLRAQKKEVPETKDKPRTPPVLDLGELTLDEGVRVEVAVIDSQGRPIAGAQVGAMQGTPPKVLFYQARTATQGTAELSGLDAAAPVQVTCLAPGYVRLELRYDAAPALVRCALERLAGLEGTVVNEEDKPVAAATVAVRRSDNSTQTGKDGTFVLDSLEPGGYEITIAAPGFRAAKREVTLASQERLRLEPVRLEKAGPLNGRVIDGETEEPVAGAVLTVQYPPGSGGARSDADGLFTLRAAADGPLAVEVTAAGYPATPIEVPAGREDSGEPLVVELLPGGRIQVTIWDEEAEAPCLGCSAGVTALGGAGEILTMDADGQALSKLLAPGLYRVSREKVQTFGAYMTVSSGDDTRTVQVEPGKTAQVSFGERRTTLTVAFFPPPPSGWALLADAASYHLRLEPREDGTFRVRKDPGEEVPMALHFPNQIRVETVRVPADFAEPELRVTLPETLVRGTLLRGEGQEPLPGVRIELLAAPGRAPAGWVVTGPDGSFAVPYLRPGTYQMVADGKPLGTFELTPGAPLDLGPLS